MKDTHHIIQFRKSKEVIRKKLTTFFFFFTEIIFHLMDGLWRRKLNHVHYFSSLFSHNTFFKGTRQQL